MSQSEQEKPQNLCKAFQEVLKFQIQQQTNTNNLCVITKILHFYIILEFIKHLCTLLSQLHFEEVCDTGMLQYFYFKV